MPAWKRLWALRRLRRAAHFLTGSGGRDLWFEALCKDLALCATESVLDRIAWTRRAEGPG